MKLIHRLLIPIVLVSLFSVGLCGFLYYGVTQRQVDSIYRSEIRATLARLEDEMDLTTGVNTRVMQRVDAKNIALAHAIASFYAQDEEYYASTTAMAALAEKLAVDVVCIVAADGLNVAGSNPGYIGRNMMEKEDYRFLFDHMEDQALEVVMEPVVNSAGIWVQYYIVAREDAPGLVMVGIEYSVSTILAETFTNGLNAEVTTVGESGHIAILHGSVYAAHRDQSLVGIDVAGESWYQALAGTSTDIQLLEIDGETYLVGHTYYDDTTMLVAMLPQAEYTAPTQSLRQFTWLLILFSSAIIIAVLLVSLRRNVTRPLQALSQTMDHVAHGDLRATVKGRFTGEMEHLRRDVNRTIGQLRDRQNNILHSFPGIVWCCNASYECIAISGHSMQQLGLAEADFIGKDIRDAGKVYDGGELASIVTRTLGSGQPQRLSIQNKGRWFSITTSLMFDEAGTITGMVGAGTDVTDLHETQLRLERITIEAERASAAKSEFLSRMSHEIRTPMNAIVGMTTIAQRSSDPAKIDYCLERIQTANDQLLHLINDILDMSKIEANKFELSVAEFDFERMLQSVSNVIEVKAGEKKQEFVVDFSELFTRNVVADEMRLSQVLINLLGNAVKFTPEGGRITLRIRYQNLDASLGRFTFDVIDNGIGITEEQQKRLFTSFEQADGSITRRFGGTGLGLAISKNIVNLMGGDIQLQSQPGKGSCFSFTVNLSWGNPKGTKDLVNKLPIGDIRVLVIDDSEDVCMYFENILRAYDLPCDAATSGPDGIRSVAAAMQASRPYDLIFVDWLMPGMDGIETARRIKQMAPPNTIVIMISVADWSDIEREANAIGVDKFLAKPVLPTILFESIVEWLNAAKANQPLAPPRALVHGEFSGKRMLLAEDIDINREIITGLLEDTGIHVNHAEDGHEALGRFIAENGSYDVILMDIQMPGMDGYDCTAQIRESGLPTAATVPIIAMTANAFKVDIEKCLAAGMNDHIAKPVSEQDLLVKLRAALE